MSQINYKNLKKATIAHFLNVLNEKINKKLNENLDSAGVEAEKLAHVVEGDGESW